jgi:hypothetical protein
LPLQPPLTPETPKDSKWPSRISPRRAEALAKEATLAEEALSWLKKPPVYPKVALAPSGDGGGDDGDSTGTEEDLPFPRANDKVDQKSAPARGLQPKSNKKLPLHPKAVAALSGDGGGDSSDGTDTKEYLSFPAANDNNNEVDHKPAAHNCGSTIIQNVSGRSQRKPCSVNKQLTTKQF